MRLVFIVILNLIFGFLFLNFNHFVQFLMVDDYIPTRVKAIRYFRGNIRNLKNSLKVSFSFLTFCMVSKMVGTTLTGSVALYSLLPQF